MAAAKEGKREEAQKLAEAAKTCYDYDASYWTMRAQLVPLVNSPRKTTHEDAIKALRYINKALEVEPENDLILVQKSSYLFAASKNKEGRKVYESILNRIINNKASRKEYPLLEPVTFELSPFYINTLNAQQQTARARKNLAPFLARICTKRPKLRRHYANELAWVANQLAPNAGKRVFPEPSSARKTQPNATDKACAQFIQTASAVRQDAGG